MAYASASQGGYGSGPSVIHADASHPDAVSISDAELLFTGHLECKGPDLVLTGHDGHHHIVPGYFSTEHHADLVAPNGARITGELVDLLAGSPAPGQYAQAQATAPTSSIGRIEKVVGDVTVMRNGVAVAVHVGDAVYKNDVVQTGADSSCGIGFPDGTALNLVANTRMALNDYVYDPNGTSNDALFNLVQGGFAFVAGKVAHTGDMKIGTPVATMGIRGTTGYALEQVATVNANVGNVTMSFAVVADPGTDRVGQYDLIDQFGNVVARIGQAGVWTNLSFQGANQSPNISYTQMTAANYSIEQALVPALVQILNNINNLSPTPQSGPNNPGSSTPPIFELINLPQTLQQNSGTPFSINIPNNGPNGSSTPATIVISTNPSTGAQATPTVNWTSQSNGTWEAAENWSDLSAPAAPEFVDVKSPVKVTIAAYESASGLLIINGAIVNVVSGGALELSGGIANYGTFQLNSSGADPTLAINGTVDLLDNGKLQLLGPTASNLIIGVSGTGATLVNVDNTIIGSGTIGQGDGRLTLINGTDGTIEAKPLGGADSGLLVIDTGHTVSNSGHMTAAAGGTLQIDDNITNFGTIGANGSDAVVALEAVHISRGKLETQAGGVIETLTGASTLLNVALADKSIVDAGAGTILHLRGSTVLDGTVTFEGNGTFNLEGAGAALTGKAGTSVELNNFGTINGAGTIGTRGMVLVNHAIIDADQNHGVLTLDPAFLTNTGTIEAANGATLLIDLATVSNTGGTIMVSGVGSVVQLTHTTIDGGIIIDSGKLEVITNSEIESAAVDGDGPVTVASDQTLTLDAVTLDSVTLSGGADDLDSATSTVGVSSTIENATLQNGTLDVASDQTLKLDAVTLDNVILSGGTDDLDSATSTVGVSSTIENATLQNGTLDVALDQTLTLEAVTLDSVTLSGGTDDLDSATSTVGVSSTIENATLQNGTLDVALDQTLTLDAVTLDSVILSGGTDDLDSATSTVGVSGTIENATLQNGTLDVAPGQTLTLDAVTLDSVTLSGGTDDLDSATSTVGVSSTIENATLQNGTLDVASDQTLTLDAVTLDSVILSGGTVDLDGAISEVSGDSTIEYTTLQDGTLVGLSGQTLTLEGVALDSVTLLGGTVDLDGAISEVSGDSTIEYTTLQDGTLVGLSGQTLTLEGVALDSVTLLGGTDDLDGAISAVSGDSTIEYATLQDGTLVMQSGQTLTLEGVALDSATLLGGTIDLDGAISAVSGDSTIEYATLQDGTLVMQSGQTLTLEGVALDGATLLGGTIDLDAAISAVSGDSVIEYATLQDGTLVMQSGQTLTLEGVALDGATLLGGTVDLEGAFSTVSGDSTIEYAAVQDGNLRVASGQTLTLDGVSLDSVTLSGGTVDLDGAFSTMSGDGTIEYATLQDGTLTVASGQTLTMNDVTFEAGATIKAAGVLTLADGSTIDNAGLLVATGGGELDIEGMQINNTGTGGDGIVVTGVGSELLVDTTTLQLVGDGTMTLASSGAIVGNGSRGTPDTLENVDNTITGAGTIGDAGNAELALINDVNGTIDANGGTLTVDTGNTVVNAGLLGATNGGTLDVTDNIKGTGNIEIGNDAMVELGGTATNTVTFEGSTGTLQIDSTGSTAPYSLYGGGAEIAAGNTIYLPNISFHEAADSYNSTTGVITVSNGTPGGTVTIDVAGGIGADDTFNFTSEGTGTMVYDPVVLSGSNQQTASVAIDGRGDDNFIFHPGMGAETIANFNPQVGTIELDHFADIKNVQQLASLITTDARGDAVIELGHHDSITVPGVTTSYLQAHLQSLVHLH